MYVKYSDGEAEKTKRIPAWKDCPIGTIGKVLVIDHCKLK
jgi:hypothetical protein